MPQVLAFDVNETLLDLAALDPVFADRFGDAALRRRWFDQVLQCAFVLVATGRHADFGAVGRAALDMVAEREGQTITDDDWQAVAAGMRSLPAHPDVPDALARLADAGMRMAALTNSPPPMVAAQLDHAGLSGFFEAQLTVEAVGRLKPAAEVYHHAADAMGVQPPQLRLIAAHSWDCTGAIRAGCTAAFVARAGQVLDPLGETPDLIGDDLNAIAEQLLAGHRG